MVSSVNQTLFLIVLAVVLIHLQGDLVNYDVKVNCDIPGEWWCANVLLYEVDHGFDDDPWSMASACTTNASHIFFSPDFYPGGDQYKSDHYEIGILIYHNCTTDENNRVFGSWCNCLAYDTPLLKANVFKWTNHQVTYDLKNIGRPGLSERECDIPKAFGTRWDHTATDENGVRCPCFFNLSDYNVTNTHSYIPFEIRPDYEKIRW